MATCLQNYNLKFVEWISYYIQIGRIKVEGVTGCYIILYCLKYIYGAVINLKAYIYSNNVSWSAFTLKSTIYSF